LTFNPDETSKQIVVPIIGDTTVEPDETFFVNLSNPSGATIVDGQGLATIQNDDVFSIASFSDGPDPVVYGSTLTLTANEVTASDGSIIEVTFYRDSNANGVLDLQSDDHLATDANPDDGWAWSGSTTDFPVGTSRYFARAQKDNGEWTDVATTVSTVVDHYPQLYVLSVGVRDEASLLAGDLAAQRVHSAFAQFAGVAANDLLLLDAAQSGNRQSLVEAIDVINSAIMPGDTFIFYFASHGGYYLDGDETPVQAQYDANNLLARQETTGDEYLLLCRPDAPQNMTDDDFSLMFADETWEQVDKLFVVDTSFSGGFFGAQTYGDSGDLAGLSKAALIAAAAEGNFGPSMYDSASEYYINVLGIAMADALEVLKDESKISFEQLFQQINVNGSVFNGTDGRVLGLADNWTVDTTVVFEPVLSQTEDFSGAIETVDIEAIPFGGRERAQFQDAQDRLVTVRLIGPGTGEVIRQVGQQHNPRQIILEGTTSRSVLRITTTRGNTTAVGDIIVAGSLRSLAAQSVALQGNLDVTGVMATLIIDDIADGASVTTHQASNRFMVRAGAVGAVDFDIAGSVRLFRADSFSDGTLQADSIGTVMLGSGGLGADIEAQAGSIRAIIAGEVTGDINAAGAINMIMSRAGDLTGRVKAGADINRIIAAGEIAADVTADGKIKMIMARGGAFTGAAQAGADIGRILAFGDITGRLNANGKISTIMARGGDFTGTARAGADIGTVSADNLDHAILSTANNIRSVRVKNSIRNSYILGGYDIGPDGRINTGDEWFNPDGAAIGSVLARGGSFDMSYVLAGIKPYEADLSTVIAPPGQTQVIATHGTIGNVLLGQVLRGDPDFGVYGIFASSQVGTVRTTEVPGSNVPGSNAPDFQVHPTNPT